jgi:hypothetical protein
MNKDDFKINLPEGTKELWIGSLPNLVERQGYSFVGNIQAPFDYFHNKYLLSGNDKLAATNLPGEPVIILRPEASLTPFAKFDMIVEINRKDLSITFREDNHTDKDCATVTGKIALDPKIMEFGINIGSKLYSGQDLAQFLNFNRLLFKERDKCLTLVDALRKFKAKIDQEIEAANDNKGNKKYVFEQAIRQEHELRFQLFWPVISGGEKQEFWVEINFDVQNRQMVFWLESVELNELIMEQTDTLLNAEIKKFKENNVTVVTT